MSYQHTVSTTPVDGVAPDILSAARALPPATSLLDLPAPLLDDIVSRALQLGANTWASTCFALFQRALLHAPAFSIRLSRLRFDHSPRVMAALRARTSRLALTLELKQRHNSGPHDNRSIRERAMALGFSLSFARELVESFPSLTALSLHGCSISCSGLASLLSHPHLSLQLQQLDLTRTTILLPQRPTGFGSVTMATIFHGARLMQLSLDLDIMNKPSLQPLAQHLTKLHISLFNPMGISVSLDHSLAVVSGLSLLQVLRVTGVREGYDLRTLLHVLPRLHTLQMPDTTFWDEVLDALLAATQLTSIQLASIYSPDSSRAEAPCSWQSLELTGGIDLASAAFLPLHSLTQPLVLGKLEYTRQIEFESDLVDLVSAAVRNLTQACRVPVTIKALELHMVGNMPSRQISALLQPLRNCCSGPVAITYKRWWTHALSC
ncbi:hypothetical protein V8C86DRAFT_509264 [Haematococcus lacustris]